MASDEHEEIEGQGFTIKDNRSSQKPEDEMGDESQPESGKNKSHGSDGDPQQKIPDLEIDFSTFVLSLTSSAFYHLGDIADPQTGKTKVELPAVKQTIDILIMLKDKTDGNLSADEAKLLEQLIYELQIKYVEKSKQK